MATQYRMAVLIFQISGSYPQIRRLAGSLIAIEINLEHAQAPAAMVVLPAREDVPAQCLGPVRGHVYERRRQGGKAGVGPAPTAVNVTLNGHGVGSAERPVPPETALQHAPPGIAARWVRRSFPHPQRLLGVGA